MKACTAALQPIVTQESIRLKFGETDSLAPPLTAASAASLDLETGDHPKGSRIDLEPLVGLRSGINIIHPLCLLMPLVKPKKLSHVSFAQPRKKGREKWVQAPPARVLQRRNLWPNLAQHRIVVGSEILKLKNEINQYHLCFF